MHIGRGVSSEPGGERQEAWYVNDRIVSVPRIFFKHHASFPSKVAAPMHVRLYIWSRARIRTGMVACTAGLEEGTLPRRAVDISA